MPKGKITSLFLGVAVAVGAFATYYNHERSELAEDLRVNTLAKGYNDAQALCVKRKFNSAPLMMLVFGSSNAQEKFIRDVKNFCNLSPR